MVGSHGEMTTCGMEERRCGHTRRVRGCDVHQCMSCNYQSRQCRWWRGLGSGRVGHEPRVGALGCGVGWCKHDSSPGTRPMLFNGSCRLPQGMTQA
jgi:hypothetical protein